MEIVIGLIMFSVGTVMASHMYYHCVHSCYLACKVNLNKQQLESRVKDWPASTND